LATLRSRQLTRAVVCSMSSHGRPPPSPAHEVGDHRRVDVGARIGRVLVGVLGDHVRCGAQDQQSTDGRRKPTKFVVTGRSECRRSTSRSARYWSSSSSEQNRRQSSRCPGFGKVGVARGGSTSAQSE
jgi:hypothetical protein